MLIFSVSEVTGATRVAPPRGAHTVLGNQGSAATPSTRSVEKQLGQAFLTANIPNFTISISKPLRIVQGDPATLEVSIDPLGKTDWNCSITLKGQAPDLPSLNIEAKHVIGPYTLPILLSVPPIPEPTEDTREYHILVTATVTDESGLCSLGESHDASTVLEVSPAPGFRLILPQQNPIVMAGSDAMFVILIQPVAGFSQVVSLSVSDNEHGITANMTRERVDLGGKPPYYSVLSVHVDNSTAGGIRSLEVRAESTGPGGNPIGDRCRVTLDVRVPCGSCQGGPRGNELLLPSVVVVGLLFGAFGLLVDLRSTVRVRSVVPSSVVSAPPRAQTLPHACPRCKRSSRVGAKFCTHCGGPLSSRASG